MNTRTKGHVMLIVGARPNLVKAASLLRAFDRVPSVRTTLLHTGQHYDPGLSEQFFVDLGIRAPDIHLGVGSDTSARQTAAIMTGLEKAIEEDRPDAVVVVGDVNSTLAGALVAKKAGIGLAHVEAGLRSFDWSMPEEVNRRVTDTLSDLLFVTEPSGALNLLKEGHDQHRIIEVGNVMVDSILYHLQQAIGQNGIRRQLGIEGDTYAYVTLHRPSNVDTAEALDQALSVLEDIGKRCAIVFPCHPRTAHRIREFGFENRLSRIPRCYQIPPAGYLDSIHLQMHAMVVLTDSGGVQEETTVLGVPCLTLRANTERPITVDEGTNTLVGLDRDRIREELDRICAGDGKRGKCPRLWDGHAAERIAHILQQYLFHSL